MLNTKTNRLNTAGTRRSRNTQGQALVESAVMMSLMILVVALLLLGLVNTYFLGTYNMRLQIAASSAARRFAADKWWLGVERPEYKEKTAKEQTLLVLNTELKAMGLREATNFNIETRQILLRQKKTTIVRVDFDVKDLRTARGLIFPSAIALHASGISSDAEHAVTPHGMVYLDSANPSGQQVGLRIPAYDATNGNGRSANPTLLTTGTSAGEFPEAYLRLSANSDGSRIERITTPAQNTTKILETFAWTGSPAIAAKR